jgi:glucose-1-phosphate thymidylyltransferase
LTYVKQEQPKGLAHAVGFAESFVDGDSFCLYLGDAIYSKGLMDHAERFAKSGAANLNLVKPVEDPRRFGVATVENERIVRLVEKPQEPESNLAMAGLYFFGPQLWSVLPDLQPSGRGEYEITDAIQLLIDRGHEVLAGVYDGDWFDTGTLDSYLETTAYLLNGESRIDPSAVVSGEVGPHVVIGERAVLECEYVQDSVVLPGSHVLASGKIERCLLGGHLEIDGNVRELILYGN